jgi:glycosyltransferase involved in cell wall biosynthesis
MIVLLAEFYASGGTRTYVKQLLDFYHSQEVKVTLVGTELKPDNELQQILDDRGMAYTSYSNVLTGDHYSSEAKAIVSPKVWSYQFMLRERAAFRDYITKSSAEGIVVSAGTPGIFAGAAGSTPNNLYILHTYPHGKRQQLLGRLFMRRFFKQVNNLVTVSQFEKHEILRLWKLPITRCKITVIPNSTGPILPPRRRPSNSKYRVITASWVESYKNPELWLDVAKSVAVRMGRDRVQFVWLGDGSLLSDFQARAAKYNNDVDVQFLGHIEDVEYFYQGADLYLQVSSTENMSLSVIDALRHGVPAVVTDVGGLPEIVEQGASGFVVPLGSAAVIADSVVQILEDSAGWSRFSEAGERRYAECFSPELWIQRMSSLHLTIFTSDSQYE